MSPQDKVERVLKEIHITFSKCETFDGQPDKIIVDRRKFLGLLDRLNQGIYDMMEQYEQTRQSRENAERAFRKKGDEIIEDATKYADDVYAASVIYTADMLGRIRDLMDQTNESMNDLFRQFRKDLRDQKDVLKNHETELQGQLADLADTKKYLSIIEDINRERDRKNRDLKAEKEAGASYAKRTVGYTGASAPDIKVNALYFEKTGKPMPGQETASPTEAGNPPKPDIKVNTDAAYFKWKESQQKESSVPEETEKQTQEEVLNEAQMQEKLLAEAQAQMQAEVLAETQMQETEMHGTEARDMEISDDETGDMNNVEHPNPDFPTEEAIMQAVLADELAAEQEEAEQQTEKPAQTAGSILKNIIFGKS